MRVLITGGHFSPAYSLIKELKERGVDIIIAGRRYPFEDDRSVSLEYRVSKEEGLSFYEVKTGRFQRKFTAYTITSLLKTPIGLLASIRILSRAKPDIVLTFGGYIGLPVSLAARVLNIPVVLHEQTQKAGLASKIISKFAKRICVSFESSTVFFPRDKVVITGNPVRGEIFKPKKKILIPDSPPRLSPRFGEAGGESGRTIYITGGSTGSHFINSIISEILSELASDFVIIHQTGDSLKFRDFEMLFNKQKTLPQNLQKKYILKKFIYPDEIGDVFENCDLIISRSGANIIFEIMAARKMSLLIPLPHGQNEEQISNSIFLKELGVSEFIEENDATAGKVLNLIHKMFRDQKKYQKNMGNVQRFIIKDAAKRIADVVGEVYGKKKS
ncbi:MAG: UDP-N-acetylglucosamine--N-acetylmuramyl-(pentapeptide) pyrophosphoryl-undecaprenol N-acetylglucosamine transferase [Candidatus Levybacteria bacterium]|nr:UDP-N-acetylglucosamine--N-acetylmuramyl-(pentapeptide) pyrophosphoryl-undecaprenol N-acetylglucosamine transferase [Candidatus Levybacteria bacterium]